MHDYRSEDKAMRKRLESQSISGQRADICGALNKVAGLDAAQGLPGVASLLLLREARQTHEQHIRRLNRAHDRGGFDRLHPSSLRRDAASRPREVSASESDDARDESFTSPLRAARVNDASGSMAADAQTHRDKFVGQGVRAAEPDEPWRKTMTPKPMRWRPIASDWSASS